MDSSDGITLRPHSLNVILMSILAERAELLHSFLSFTLLRILATRKKLRLAIPFLSPTTECVKANHSAAFPKQANPPAE